MTGIVHPARSSRSRPPSPMAAEVTTLLQRYPHLREAEMDRLVEIYPQLAMLDVALMTNDEAVAPKLDHFVRKNKGRLRTPVSHILWLAALPAAAIAAALWALAMPAMAG
jgi:hypothetical protein